MAPKFHLFIALGFLTFTACINKDHYTLGPIEDLDSSYLPRGMLPAEKSKARDEAQTMVLWILSKNIEKTKSDPPAMLRGLAYLEYVYNDFLGDFQTAVPTKKSIKKIIISTRDALGIPLHLSPRKTINLYWSTAKLMEINKFSKSELSQSMTATLEKLSEVKSAINLAIIQAKLNMILARNEKFFSEKSFECPGG